MSDIEDSLGPALHSALQTLSGPARRRLAADIGRFLRDALSRRIAEQRAPDGTPWAVRKPRPLPHQPKAGRPRGRAAMLLGLRKQRLLTVQALASGVSLGWSGRTALLAAIHHRGDVAPVTSDGPMAHYPARVLLGLEPGDAQAIRAMIAQALAASLPE